jgi:hypothetical protein
MDLLDWFFSFSTAHNFNFNFNLGFSNEVTFTSAFDTKGTPGLELPSLHSTDYEPKASDARRLDTWFVLHKQVIRRDDTIVHPHLQSKIQESFEDCG